MSKLNAIELADPKKLKNHMLSIEVYGEDKLDDEFLDSVKRRGIVNPLLVLRKSQVVVSGHRRMRAARMAKLKTVPVIYLDGEPDDEKIRLLVLDANNQREKTAEQKAREFAKRKELLAAQAAERKKRHEPATGKTSREVAAEAVGWSGPTAEKAVSVVKEIDKAAKEGDKAKVEELRGALRKSVDKAHKLVAPNQESKGKADKSAAPAKTARTGKGPSAFVKLQDLLGLVGPGIDECARERGGRGVYYKQAQKQWDSLCETVSAWRKGDCK